MGQKRRQRNGNAPTCNTASGKCMPPALAPGRTMVRRQAGCPRRQRQAISMRSIPLRAYTIGGRVWPRMTQRLYGCSAEQGNPCADYELAKMYRDGIDTPRDNTQAEICFQDAFSGFLHLEEKSGDDRLQYRLGHMLHTGTGTERDDDAAADYWERAAKLGNVHAQYALGKLWLENGSGNTMQAVRWITKAAEAGNAAAQYTLGKLCLSGEVVEKDAARAVEMFTLSAGSMMRRHSWWNGLPNTASRCGAHERGSRGLTAMWTS